jgi:hypothetical protein
MYYQIYVVYNAKKNNISVDCQGPIGDLEDRLIRLFTLGYHIDIGMLDYFIGNLSHRQNNTLPKFGCAVNPALHFCMPFYFEWRDNEFMYPWVQKIFYGKCRSNDPALDPYENSQVNLENNTLESVRRLLLLLTFLKLLLLLLLLELVRLQ